MRNLLLLLFGLILTQSCNQSPEGFTINGSLRGDLEDGTQVFLKTIGEGNQPIEVDTTTIKEGKFEFTGTSEKPELYYIFVDNTKGYTAVILENGEIEFEASIDSLGFAEIGGTPQNDYFSNYMEESRKISLQAKSIQEDLQRATTSGGTPESIAALRDEMQELTEEYQGFETKFVKENPNALISALLLERAISTKTVDSSEAQKLYDAFSEEIKQSKPGKNIMELLDKLKQAEESEKNTSIGATAPNFSGPNPEGKTLELKKLLGKATLVDFWAAWCRPCRAENPNIVSVYEKYHDKGLNIVGVSLDRTADAWKKAIEDDGLDWNHISNIAYFDDEIAKLYNVEAIPAAFLLDENGVIVAKDLRGPALEQKVAELLN
ncbi:TlpA disulfide reductase family protein [Maribacter cobaltidurans]|uniref:Thioredoxin n=1 Tax=Maribacter cobaltidurans TaxID=1178778 RepID=A0A223V9Q7_9FLAO|nr:TlpA disulfide reductase family protein [Maribacter cobaltidurans]ASV32046.1 thioredoxin [Maribacter cobaltidurans]GGD86722.1 thiol:disulfide interchange protein [Maribacter cobaltidurans]